MLSAPEDGLGGVFSDSDIEVIVGNYEQSTYSLAFAVVYAPGHALMDMKCAGSHIH